MPARIAEIARTHLDDPVTIQLDKAVRRADATANVRQVAYIVTRPNKIAALSRVLDVEHPVSAIVFCRTRTEVDELAETLNARGYRADALHGGLSQEQRDTVMRKFRGRKTDLLVATDVAARGLDDDESGRHGKAFEEGDEVLRAALCVQVLVEGLAGWKDMNIDGVLGDIDADEQAFG